MVLALLTSRRFLDDDLRCSLRNHSLLLFHLSDGSCGRLKRHAQLFSHLSASRTERWTESLPRERRLPVLLGRCSPAQGGSVSGGVGSAEGKWSRRGWGAPKDAEPCEQVHGLPDMAQIRIANHSSSATSPGKGEVLCRGWGRRVHCMWVWAGRGKGGGSHGWSKGYPPLLARRWCRDGAEAVQGLHTEVAEERGWEEMRREGCG